ncbi:hypothetical protein GCM10027280_61250 [Micromonospora polyrhachis]|uniref:Tetratricopeptide (TPR) repeat protein n=1 Tax=Micromonospora polyrhachis TaxID=1282883 RepID=A0A7W7SN55_9ACTN|nr:AAA family ATPase [Micromonospora polyrhachis]MBB4957854.1 tetratricopeptide (TPR) repeat protein [Micromonospora polyrhachis]
MPMKAFVDRENEFAIIRAFVEQACAGQGGILVVEGPAGIGKSALLDRVTAAGGPATFIPLRCHAQVGQLEAYGPLLDLLAQMEETRSRRKRLLRRSGESFRSRWPELLTLVPSFGPTLKMVAETLSGPVPGAPLVDNRMAARSIAEAVLLTLREKQPVVVMIDDAHRIDGSSCAALSYLSSALADQPVLLVLAARDDELTDNPPARHLVEDLCLHDMARRLRLGGLPVPAVAELAQLVVGRQPSASTARRITEQTGGYPFLLQYYFSEEKTRLALPAAAVTLGDVGNELAGNSNPESGLADQVGAVIWARLRRLSDDDLRLLSVASVQGREFHSKVVARLVEQPHDAVATRLHRLGKETRLIYPVEPDDWDESIGSDRYSFEHDLLQETLYRDQTPSQRRERHRKIGQVMGAYSQEHPEPPQEIALDLVRHHRMARDWLAAGRAAHDVACRLATTGASTREVVAITAQGLDDIRRMRGSSEADRLRAQLIELMLTASELSWRTRPEADGTVRLEALSTEALAAARTAGDIDLEIRIRYLHGKVLLYTRGVPAALGPLREAWERALHSGNAVSILLAGCEYGRQLPKADVAAGLQVLHQTETTVAGLPEVANNADPVVQRARYMLALQLGISLFDAGQIGPALDRLRTTIPAVRLRAALGLLPIGLNYLAQVEAAAGNLAESEALLTEAVELNDGSEPDGWHAVNLAYLGTRMTLDRAEPAGLPLLEQARAEAELTWQANLAPLVANLYATSLIAMAATNPIHYDTARQILEECLSETRRTGMRRSEIVALSLLGRLHLAVGDTMTADGYSAAAVDKLREVDWRLAAVCVEEVLYHHSRIQEARGDGEGAHESLRLARAEVLRKAGSLTGPARERFLQAVDLNQRISAGHG